jgi:SAM-dependent methyltransferase
MTLDTYYTEPAVAADYDRVVRAIDDVPFYVELAEAAAMRGDGVLELACGTGRVTLPVALTGAPTTGLDNSVAMLAIAERKSEAAGVDVTWAQGDMASFRLEQRFGLVIIPCRSFLLLSSVEAQKSCLARIREQLIDGGLLALNIFNPDLRFMASRLGDRGGEWERASGGSLAKRHYHTAEQNLIELRQEYDTGPDNAPVHRMLRARYIFRYEMQHLLALCGFEVEALYGWFDGRPFDDASTEMVWVARKA